MEAKFNTRVDVYASGTAEANGRRMSIQYDSPEGRLRIAPGLHGVSTESLQKDEAVRHLIELGRLCIAVASQIDEANPEQSGAVDDRFQSTALANWIERVTSDRTDGDAEPTA